jgi:hypothetical protein
LRRRRSVSSITVPPWRSFVDAPLRSSEQAGDETYTPVLVTVGDDSFWHVRVWMVRVDEPSNPTAEIVSVVTD